MIPGLENATVEPAAKFEPERVRLRETAPWPIVLGLTAVTVRHRFVDRTQAASYAHRQGLAES